MKVSPTDIKSHVIMHLNYCITETETLSILIKIFNHHFKIQKVIYFIYIYVYFWWKCYNSRLDMEQFDFKCICQVQNENVSLLQRTPSKRNPWFSKRKAKNPLRGNPQLLEELLNTLYSQQP